MVVCYTDVYYKEKQFDETVQRVEIYYKMIGHIDLPEMSRAKLESYAKSFGINKKDCIA